MVSLLNKYFYLIEIKADIVWPMVGHFYGDPSFPTLFFLPSPPTLLFFPILFIPLPYFFFPRPVLPYTTLY